MAKDLKYGTVTLEHGTIGEDEPVVVFRAKDVLLPGLLNHYMKLCAMTGSSERHIDLIQESRDRIIAWQNSNAGQVKVPDSEASREWMGR